jgi:hypothetical protein
MSPARARLDRRCAPPVVLFALDGTLSRLDGGLIVVWPFVALMGRAAGALKWRCRLRRRRAATSWPR